MNRQNEDILQENENQKKDIEYYQAMCKHLRSLLDESRWEITQLTSVIIRYIKSDHPKNSKEWRRIHDRLVALTGVNLDTD